jgi:biopolymer transport protein ExbD
MQAGDNKSFDDINVTPMVDLYLVLLLIFIIMTTASVQSMKVNIPKAGGPAKPDNKAPKAQAIVLDNAGKITLNGKPMANLGQLEQTLTAVKARTPEFPTLVRGDSQTPYQEVMNVLDLLNRLGIKGIGLATKPKN